MTISPLQVLERARKEPTLQEFGKDLQRQKVMVLKLYDMCKQRIKAIEWLNLYKFATILTIALEMKMGK